MVWWINKLECSVSNVFLCVIALPLSETFKGHKIALGFFGVTFLVQGFFWVLLKVLGLDFWLHSIINVTWNPEYPPPPLGNSYALIISQIFMLLISNGEKILSNVNMPMGVWGLPSATKKRAITWRDVGKPPVLNHASALPFRNLRLFFEGILFVLILLHFFAFSL